MIRLARGLDGRTRLVVYVDGGTRVVDAVIAAQTLSGSSAPGAAEIAARLADSGQSWRPLIADWDAARPEFEALVAAVVADLESDDPTLQAVALEEFAFAPPLVDPAARIIAMGGNFAGHATGTTAAIATNDSVRLAAAKEAPPWGFYVIPGTIVGAGADVTPPVGTQKLDYEAEVAGILLPPTSPDESWRLWGYTAWNDFSIRDAALGLSHDDHGPLTWSVTKNFATGHACGPWVVVDAPDEDIEIRCTVDGEERQHGWTSQMIYTFDEIARYLSRFFPIEPGDMIISGTPGGPAIEGGIDGPYLKDGDVVVVEVSGIGELRSTVRLAHADA